MEAPIYVIRPITEATRRQALRLVREGKSGCDKRVQELLGWTDQCMMPYRLMAEALSIKQSRLRYLINRRAMLRYNKERKAAMRAAKAIPLVKRVSPAAKCTLFVPEHWVITADTQSFTPLAHEYLEFIARRGPSREPTSDWSVIENGHLRPMTKFERRLKAKEEYDTRIAKAKDHVRVERMMAALFQVDAPDDTAHVEVSRLELDSDISALELYQLDRGLPEDSWYGSRPKNGIQIDGLTGVLYYHSEHNESVQAKKPVFADAYLVDGRECWIISCNCPCGDRWVAFKHYKPLFIQVLKHFKRGVVKTNL